MRTIVIMRFKVAPGREEEFEKVVGERTQAIKDVPGARKVYLLKPDNGAGNEYRLVTWWDETKDLEAWIRKETYAFSENLEHPGLVVGTVPFEVARVVREW